MSVMNRLRPFRPILEFLALIGFFVLLFSVHVSVGG